MVRLRTVEPSLQVVRRVGVVVAGQKGGQPLDGVLEAGMIIDERTHSGCQPLDAELFAAAPIFKFLNAAVGEIHLDSSPLKGPAPGPVGAEYADTPCTGARHTEQESATCRARG